MNPFDLTGTAALVSGSSRGIGRALAKGLLQAGSRVIIHGRNIDQVKTTALDLAEETGGETGVSTFDVTDQGLAVLQINAPAPINQFDQVMVTIEQAGGATLPSDKIVLSGALSAALPASATHPD